MKWFRFYVDTINDLKIRRLPPAQRWLWVAVLALAGSSHEPGRLLLSDGVPVTEEDLVDAASISTEDVTDGLQAFQSKNMLHTEDGVLVVTNWGKRQFTTDDVTKRTRTFRERSKDVPQNGSGTPPDTDTDTDNRLKDKRDPPSANALGIQIESHVQVGGAQSQTGNGQRPSAEKPNEYTYEFELFWNSYPRRIEKKSASKAWQARLRDGINSQDIIRAAQHYAKECERNKTDAKFIKHPKTFLSSNTPFEEYVDSEHFVTASRERGPQQIGRYIQRGLAKEVIAAMEEDERERQRVTDAQADSS